MNKINIDHLEYPQLRLDNVRLEERLKSCWTQQVLTGHFWRLYHNDKPGAGVRLHGKRVEMMPDKLYILPPNCELKVWCEADDIQHLYFHFEVTRITGSPDHLFNELSIPPEDNIILREIRSELREKSISLRVCLLSIALASGCMSRLPREALHELGTDRRIFDVCARIRENPAYPYSIEDLAKFANMAPNSFLRLFREITGSTPYQYLLNIRYALAARLLRTTDIKIEEICEAIGVNDRFHFSRRFKNFYGFSPAAYRRQYMSQALPPE